MTNKKLAVPMAVFALQVASISRLAGADPGYQFIQLYTPGAPAAFDSTNYWSRVGVGGEIGGYGGGVATNNKPHAVFASPDHPDGVDIHPAGRISSYVEQCTNGFQVGYSSLNTDVSVSRATIWRGTRESAIDLHPAGYAHSSAQAATALTQVGDAQPSGGHGHAMLWHGSGASAIDLHPNGYVDTAALGTDDAQQVGTGDVGGTTHALLWAGSAASVIDLTPPGYIAAQAIGVALGEQVGFAYKSGMHALLWHGTAQSVVDLNGVGELHGLDAYAYATNGHVQVGEAQFVFGQAMRFQAVAWLGTAESRIDLYKLLPPDFLASRATSVAADGTVYGDAYDLAGKRHIVAWVVPEPGAVSALIPLAIVAMSRRDRRRAARDFS